MKKFFTLLSVFTLSCLCASAQDDGEWKELTAEDFKSWSAADETGIATGAVTCALALNESTGLPYGDGNVYYLSYADLTNADKFVITATEGTPRLLFNRKVDQGTMGYEYPKTGTFVTKTTEGDVTTYTVDITALVKAQGFAHLHAIKGANWANTTVTSMKYHIPAEPVGPVYNPITIFPQNLIGLDQLSGTDTDWASRISYPKVFQSQGEVFGNGDGSSESQHVDISSYSTLTFSVSSGSDQGLALRAWLWDDANNKVVTLYPHPYAEYETANFSEAYEIKEPGIYAINIENYKYLKGIKAANKWAGQSPITVDYACVSNEKIIPLAVNEARTLSSNKILDFTNVTDVEAYIATNYAGGKLQMTKVTGAVPANTGLVLLQKSNKAVISIPTCGQATEDVSKNMLVATTEETTLDANYVLAGSGDKLGWYKVGETAAKLAAGKSYLKLQNNAAKVKMTFGEETAISTVTANNSNDAIYNLNGQRVSKAQKGLYIVNGKKVLY